VGFPDGSGVKNLPAMQETQEMKVKEESEKVGLKPCIS